MPSPDCHGMVACTNVAVVETKCHKLILCLDKIKIRVENSKQVWRLVHTQVNLVQNWSRRNPILLNRAGGVQTMAEGVLPSNLPGLHSRERGCDSSGQELMAGLGYRLSSIPLAMADVLPRCHMGWLESSLSALSPKILTCPVRHQG